MSLWGNKWQAIGICVLFLLMLFHPGLASESPNPVANEEAVVVAGKARFTVLTPRLIRLEWSPTARFMDSASIVFINRRLPVPSFQIQYEGDWLLVKTQFLTLKYRLSSTKFSQDNLSIEYHDPDTSFTWHPGMVNPGNLKGTASSLDDHNGRFHRDSGKPLQLSDGLISRSGWTVIDDSNSPILDDADLPWAQSRQGAGAQDFYFFAYGLNYKTALKDFIQVAGHIPLPPKFVFGIWWSRYWEYTDQDLRQIANDYRYYQIPLNVLMVDMDWHITSLPEFFEKGKRKRAPGGKRMGWTGFTWNRHYFPEPVEFLSWMHSRLIQVGLNLHMDAGILPHEARYPELAKSLGMDPALRQPIPFRLFDKSFMQKFFSIMLEPLEHQGVDFWWLDWQNWETGPIPGLNTQFWLNYVFYHHSAESGKRPLILSRYGGLGSHRYPVGFSGDASISWQSLDFQPYFTATAANVAYGYWSHDIGGHTRGVSPPELYTRWVQFGAFSPVFRTHATKNEKIERRFWAYPLPYFNAMKKAVQLRSQLFPYIYTAAFQAYQTGITICHPLYYEFPQYPEAYRFKNEYFFGDRILVHPLTHPIGKDSLFTFQKVWLPPGEWIEWETGTVLKGNQIYNRPFMLDEIPLYVKTGAIIPMHALRNADGHYPANHLILNVFPGRSDEIQIYDDDGITHAYQNGVYTLTPVRSYATKNELEVVIGPMEGKFPGMVDKRSYEIRLPLSFPPEAVEVNGKRLTYHRYGGFDCWTYNGEALETRIYILPRNVSIPLKIKVIFSRLDWQALSGLVTQIKRLKTFATFLAARGWDKSRYSNDQVVWNTQVGLRMSQNPRNVATVLEKFQEEWQQILITLKDVESKHPEFKPYWQLLEITKSKRIQND